MNGATRSGWRQVRRQLWIKETPVGRFGIMRNGFWYLAIDFDGSTAGRRRSRSRALRLLPR